MSKTRHKPPSRIRYEKNNPIVSFRIKKTSYEELKTLLKNQGNSIGDFFKVALKKQQIDYDKLTAGGYDKGFEDGHEDGFGEGWEKGFNCFNVPCKICGKPMQFDIGAEPETEQIVKEAFKNWHHKDCANE